jgi:hypothetical protein
MSITRVDLSTSVTPILNFMIHEYTPLTMNLVFHVFKKGALARSTLMVIRGLSEQIRGHNVGGEKAPMCHLDPS